VQVWVEDTGPGIPPEQQAYIFSKYARLSEHRGIVKGIGLGLAFCRLAIEGHGGCIWVESQANSAKTGSRFVCILPVAQEKEQQAIIMDEGWRQKK
jgi:signal transduction histidine kinase